MRLGGGLGGRPKPQAPVENTGYFGAGGGGFVSDIVRLPKRRVSFHLQRGRGGFRGGMQSDRGGFRGGFVRFHLCPRI